MNFDNYGGQVGELISHNGYAYCMNNPLNMKDEQGNSTTVAIGGLLLGMLILYVGSQTTTMPETSSGIHIDLPTFSSSKEDVAKKAMTKAKTKEETKIKAKQIEEENKYYIAQATHPGANVYLSQPLTREMAKMRVEIGGDVWCRTDNGARKLGILMGGLTGPTRDSDPNNAIHYHAIKYLRRAHIFFGPDPNLNFIP